MGDCVSPSWSGSRGAEGKETHGAVVRVHEDGKVVVTLGDTLDGNDSLAVDNRHWN